MPERTSWRRLASQLGLRHTIIQAPMGGGITPPELVAAVCNAGGLGSIAAGYLSPRQILDAAREVKARTTGPFAVNLFIPSDADVPPERMARVLERFAGLYADAGLPPPTAPERILPDFDEQLEAVLQTGCLAFSFTFGIPSAEAIARVKARRIVLMGTATRPAEARALEAAGVDVVVAQGSEAGGQRGAFLAPGREALGTFSLVPQVVDAVALPVVAAGGIMDGRGVRAAAALGAAGVQLGTAFLTCAESGASSTFKDAVLNAGDAGTVLSTALTGRWGRSLANALTGAFREELDTLPFPLQHALTLPIRRAAAARADVRWMGMFAGQGAPMARPVPAAALMAELREAADRGDL